MRRIMKLVTVLAVLVAAGSVAAWTMQRPDLAGQLAGCVTVTPGIRANTAVTGAWCDLGRAPAVAMLIAKGITEVGIYVVVQDSTAGSAVATRDSVLVGGTADSTLTYYDFNYRNAGRWVRALQRASGGAGDSTTTAVLFVAQNRAR